LIYSFITTCPKTTWQYYCYETSHWRQAGEDPNANITFQNIKQGQGMRQEPWQKTVNTRNIQSSTKDTGKT